MLRGTTIRNYNFHPVENCVKIQNSSITRMCPYVMSCYLIRTDSKTTRVIPVTLQWIFIKAEAHSNVLQSMN